MSIESYVRAIPKAELHVHLEGAIQPSTVFTLVERNHVELPAHDETALRRLFTYRDFDHFIEIFLMAIRCLKTVEDLALTSM